MRYIGKYGPGHDNSRRQALNESQANGIKTALYALYNADPPPAPTKTAVRAQISAVAGAQWDEEDDDWYFDSCQYLFNDGHDYAIRAWLYAVLITG